MSLDTCPSRSSPTDSAEEALSFALLTALPLFVAYTAAKNAARQPSPQVLLLGCGMLSIGYSGLVGVVAGHYGDVNLHFTVYHIGMSIAGMCHIAGAGIPGHRPSLHHAKLWTGGAYALVLCILGIVTVGTAGGWTPVVFTPGRSDWGLQQVVCATSAGLFALAGVLTWLRHLGTTTAFIRWYATGLGLFAVALGASVILTDLYSPVSWLARLAAYLGSIYILVAVIIASRQSGNWRSSLELALRESEQRFQTLVESMPQLVWATDDHGQATYVCRNWTRYTGLIAADSYGQGWTAACHPDDLPGHLASWRHAVDTGRNWRAEVRLRRAHDGSYRWHLVQGAPMRDDAGGIRGWVGTCTDIHGAKQVEQTVREEGKRFRSMADGLPVPVWLCGPAGRLEFVNRTYCDFFGGTVDDFRGDNWTRLLHPEDAQAYVDEYRACIRECRPFRACCRVRRSDGQWRWIESHGHPQFSPGGQFLGLVGGSPDITDRKAAEAEIRQAHAELEQRVRERTAELRRRNEQLGRLASELTLAEQHERRRMAEILHDHLQQVLAAAKMRLGSLATAPPQGQSADLDEVIGLVDECIRISRSLTVELAPPVLSNRELVAAMQWLVDWFGQKHGLEVELKAEGAAVTDHEDVRILVFQAVRELLFNIVKHAGVDQACIEMAAPDPDHLRVTVSDRGKGFDGRPRDADSGGGKGFGLFAISERMMLLGGSMEIDSRIGGGSRFTLRVPLRKQPAVPEVAGVGREASVPPMSARGGEAATRSDGSTQHIRLLLVDDHALVRQGLAAVLSQEDDMEVIGQASNGIEALEQAKVLQPGIVLMDLAMPKMNGVEATACIRHQMPHIQVIGLSVDGQPDHSAAMIEAGAAAFVVKSGTADVLTQTIRRVHEAADTKSVAAAPGGPSVIDTVARGRLPA